MARYQVIITIQLQLQHNTFNTSNTNQPVNRATAIQPLSAACSPITDMRFQIEQMAWRPMRASTNHWSVAAPDSRKACGAPVRKGRLRGLRRPEICRVWFHLFHHHHQSPQTYEFPYLRCLFLRVKMHKMFKGIFFNDPLNYTCKDCWPDRKYISTLVPALYSFTLWITVPKYISTLFPIPSQNLWHHSALRLRYARLEATIGSF